MIFLFGLMRNSCLDLSLSSLCHSQMWEEAIALGKELAEQYETEMFDYEQLSELLVSPCLGLRLGFYLDFPFGFHVETHPRCSFGSDLCLLYCPGIWLSFICWLIPASENSLFILK